MNEDEQKRFDKALISMPSCFVSTAYENNPFYDDYDSLLEFGRAQLAEYETCKVGLSVMIKNGLDFMMVQEWLVSCRSPGRCVSYVY